MIKTITNVEVMEVTVKGFLKFKEIVGASRTFGVNIRPCTIHKTLIELAAEYGPNLESLLFTSETGK